MEEPGLIGNLLAFLDTLPAGFGCGPREQMAVRELVVRLIDGGKMPADPVGLKTLIAPLVCGDREQQGEFYDRFAEWMERRRAEQRPAEPPVLPPSRQWPGVPVAALLAAGVLSAGVYLGNMFQAIPNVRPPATHPYEEPSSSVTTAPKNRVSGIIRTTEGDYPVGEATVWIPFGTDTAQYPKVVTDARGGFAIELAATWGNTGRETLKVRGQPMVLQGPAPVTSVAFSPDGSKLATDTARGAELWDTATGKVILTMGDHSNSVWRVAFSPDGRKLATSSEDKTAKVWDVGTGKELLTLRGHLDAIWCVAFSPDGRKLATASNDHTAKVWDAATGKETLTLVGHAADVRGVAFSPDGRMLATASYDSTVKIWNVSTGGEIQTLRGHAGWVMSVAFSPDGRTVATAGNDDTAGIWDLSSGTEILTLRGHSASIYGVAFSPDARWLATVGEDTTAKIWDASTGKEVLTLSGHRNRIRGVAFRTGGRRVATGSSDATARIWDLETVQSGSVSRTAAALSLLVTHPDYEPAYLEHAAPGAFHTIQLGPLRAAQRVLKFETSPVAPSRRFPRWVSIGLGFIPLCAAVLAYWRQRRRDQELKAFLDQWETHLDFEPVRVHTRSEEDELFQGGEVATVARELRRRRPEPTSQLAIEPTVRATADRAGLFTPIRLQRRAAREYLVLLESKGGRDQQAKFWNCFLDRLAAREVWLDRYSFPGDPRVCEVPTAERGWLRLEEIAALHPRHELWIVAGAGRFFDATTRLPAPWVPALARWSERAVLSLTSGTAEDREQLADLGFAVAPASVAGLAELNSDVVRQSQYQTPAPYPAALEEDEGRWLQGPAPSGEAGARALRSLDRQLRGWLGRDGYRLLVACSVYPGLAWNLTLHLALALIPAAERENTLARLVRLPWFRHGRMPQWLRAFLAEKLEAEESARVMGLLREFLERKAPEQAGAAPGLEFAKREIAAEMRAQDQAPTREYVFLSFLLGRKPRLRDLEAPAWLRHLLYPDGLPVLHLRREFWLASGLLVGGLVYAGAERIAHFVPKAVPPQWREISPPRDVASDPVNQLSARALEIAAAHLGQPIAAEFADAMFDKAVAFAAPRGAARSGAVRPGMKFVPGSGGTPAALVERVVEGGLITLESFEGRLRRVFHATAELAGSFVEVTEQAR